MRSSSKDHREKPDERGRGGGQKPKILLSSQNQAKTSSLPISSRPPPLAQLCVEEAVSTLAETSAQGNSNEEETVRERQREGEWEREGAQ